MLKVHKIYSYSLFKIKIFLAMETQCSDIPSKWIDCLDVGSLVNMDCLVVRCFDRMDCLVVRSLDSGQLLV